MSFEDDMQEFGEQFSQDADSSGILKDGDYTVAIAESRVERDDANERWVVVLRLVDSGGTGSIRKWYNLDHDVSRRILAGDMRRFGYTGALGDLKEWIEAENLLDVACEIRVQTKPGTDRDYTNVYINRVLGKGVAPLSGTAAQDDGDDIPF